MVRALFAVVLALSLLAAPAASAETLTNAQVVELTQAGLGAQAVVAKIRTSDSRFDFSTSALVALKRQNVPDEVIAAMVNAAAGPSAPAVDQSNSADPMAAHTAGVYLLEASGDRPWMQRLDPTVATESRASNVLGWILTSGVVPLKVTTVMAGPTALFKADTLRPTFYFYFNQPGSGLYQNGLGMLRMSGPAPTPDVFTLIHFQSVNGEREALTQQLGFAGSTGGGAVNKTLVGFKSTAVAPGVFSVTPNDDLEPGEYAFTFTPDTDADAAEPRYFDFSVPGAAPESPTLSAAP
jgi:hypothetical protein